MPMKIISRDPYKGNLFRCTCGKKVWSHIGQAKRHRESCPNAK